MRLLSSLHNYFYLVDWIISNKKPNYYKHLTNLYNWKFNTNLHQFTTAPAIARAYLRQNARVLDLCCGDGSISYLFFSDVAQRIDAVDISSDAIEYASKTFSRNNIRFHQANIIQFMNDYSNEKYDLIYFGSGYDYFSHRERIQVYDLVSKRLADSGRFVVKTPIWGKAKYMHIQVEAQNDYAREAGDVLREIKRNFNIQFSQEITYNKRMEIIVVSAMQTVRNKTEIEPFFS